jgi:hypothetical protein
MVSISSYGKFCMGCTVILIGTVSTNIARTKETALATLESHFNMEPVVFYHNRAQVTLQMVAGIIGIPVLLWMASEPMHPRDAWVIRTFLIGSALAWAALIYKLYQRGQITELTLRIDNEGITDNVSEYPVGLIPWSDVTRLCVTHTMSASVNILHIYVKDQDKYIHRMRAHNQRARVRRTHPKAFTIKIKDFWLPMDAYELMDLINTWRQSQSTLSMPEVRK